MVKISLTNMKQYNSNSSQTFKPTKPNLKNYEIIFTTEHQEFIQFVLFIKFINKVKIYQQNIFNDLEYENFPYNGIIYSCKLTPMNPLIIQLEPLDLCTRVIIKKQIITPINNLELKPISWDKIFVINLPRRTDRKKQMEEFFLSTKINTSQYEFIDAFDGSDIEIQTQYQEKKNSNPSNPIITPGHFACLLSHLKAIELAKSRGYKQVMILEDDVNTNELDLISKLKSIELPYYDLLYLGGIMSKKKHFTTNWIFTKGTNIMGAYAYILSSSVFDIVLEGLKNLDEYIDFFYLKSIQRQKITIILNDIIKTDLNSSDTSHKSRIMIKRLDYIK
jgi:hypothetical protein